MADRIALGLVPRPRADDSLLVIDIENQPLWYGGGDYVYDIVNCVSWKWVGEDHVETRWLDWRTDDVYLVSILDKLRRAIYKATHLVGHNFSHDWKGLQATFVHLNQELLPRRPIVDTMRCIPSGPPRSLERLVEQLGVGDKPHVSVDTWIRAVLRGDSDAICTVMSRNAEDVRLTEELYLKELELGWLAPSTTRAPANRGSDPSGVLP